MDLLILSSGEETKRIEQVGDLLGTEPAGAREQLWSLSMNRSKPINIGVDGRKPDGKRHCLDDPPPSPMIHVTFPPFRSKSDHP
jgi:hypothetical protein